MLASDWSIQQSSMPFIGNIPHTVQLCDIPVNKEAFWGVKYKTAFAWLVFDQFELVIYKIPSIFSKAYGGVIQFCFYIFMKVVRPILGCMLISYKIAT